MSGRGRARGRARGAPQTQPVAEPARRPGEAVEGATTQAPGRGRARGRGRAAEPLPTTPAPASAVPVAASKAEPPTQQLGQMSLSAARSFPPAKGGSGGGGGRREDRRSRRDEQDYNPINTRPVDRENKQGLTGEQIDIVANYFALRTLPEWRIYQHMVEFSPDIPMIRMRRGMIREHDDVLGKTVAFDGTILYLTKRLPEESVTLTSKKVTDGSMVTITIKRTSELPPSSPQCLQMFNVIFRRILAKVGMQQIQRHYFSANESERATLAAHRLEIWPGFATSILQYEKRVMLCADVVHKVLRTETVLDVIADISRSNPPNFRDVVSKKLVGSVVMTRYNNKTYRVDDIDWDTKPTNKFKLSRGEEISYNEYYFKQYHKTLTDMNQPMLVSKPSKRESRGTTAIDRLNLVPELCTMTGLSVEMRENFNLMKDMGQHTRVAPQDRCKHLQELMNKIKHNDEVKQELDGFGLDFEGSLMTFKGRALPPEKILTFDRSSTYRMGEPDWTRSLRDAKLLSSPAIDDWLLLFTRRDAQKAQDFAKTLQRVATPMAIRMTPPMMVTLDNDRTESYVHAIRQNLTHNTKLVVTLLTTNRKDRYDAIKKVCCVENPVPSQVVVARTISKPQMLMSVCTKIAIQLNCKLGGEVWAVEIPLKNTMVVGFDTYHDSVNKGQSVGGFVASMNPSFTRYHSRCTFHQSGQELFDQLGTCMTSCLKNYEKINGVLPSKIIFYRDGVGEGQLNVVKEFEVAQINTCIKRIYEERRGAEEDPKKIPFPQVTFIVVTKRINTRLMMRSPDGSLRNPYAGTVVDHEVTKPEKFDFFLVSQSVRQGTVSPTYYNIIYESSSSLKADHIQRLTYKLTHLYYNWPGTIRVPAPCQYAHKLAFLVGQSIHKPPSLELSDRLFFL